MNSTLGLLTRLVQSIKEPAAFKVRWKVQPPHRAIVLCHQRAHKEKLLLSAENLSWTRIIQVESLLAQFYFYSYCLLIFGWGSINVLWHTGALSNLSTWLLTYFIPIWTLVMFLIRSYWRHWDTGRPYIQQGKVITPDKFRTSLNLWKVRISQKKETGLEEDLSCFQVNSYLYIYSHTFINIYINM